MHSFLLVVDSYAQSVEDANRQKQIETVIGLLGAAAVAGVLIYIYGRYLHYKRKKEFRFNSKFNEYNHVDALVLLGMNVLKRHPECFREKCLYIKEFVAFLYPNNQSFHESLRFSYTDYYASDTIVKWLNEYISMHQKEDTVRFLIQLAAQDGIIASQERSELEPIILDFGLPLEEWGIVMDEINACFFQRQQEWRSQNSGVSYQTTIFEKALEYFQVSSNDLNEKVLRKAYRELVKQTHPDRYPDATAEERKKHEIEFQKIQVYYEELLKRLEK